MMHALAVHFSYQFRSALRNQSQLLLSYLFPFGFYLLMGAVMTRINPGFRDNLIPALTIFTVMTGTLLGLPNTLVDEREAGIYRAYRVNGVPAGSVIAMPALTSGFHGLIAAAIIAITAGPLFDAPAPASWVALFASTVLATAVFAGFGTLIGVVSATSRTTVLLGQAIFLPSMLLGGLMVPYDMLPEGVRAVALLLPTTWMAQLEQGWAYGRAALVSPGLSAAVLAVGAVLAFGLSAYLFNWDSRNLTRRGHPLLGLLVLVPFAVGALIVAL